MVLLSKAEIVDMVERIKILNHLGKIKESDSLLKALEKGVIDPYISAEEIADKVLSYKPIYL